MPLSKEPLTGLGTAGACCVLNGSAVIRKKKKKVLSSWILYFFGRYRYQLTKQTRKILMAIAVISIFVSPSNSHVQILILNVMVSVD